jgi:hypothetical protein
LGSGSAAFSFPALAAVALIIACRSGVDSPLTFLFSLTKMEFIFFSGREKALNPHET